MPPSRPLTRHHMRLGRSSIVQRPTLTNLMDLQLRLTLRSRQQRAQCEKRHSCQLECQASLLQVELLALPPRPLCLSSVHSKKHFFINRKLSYKERRHKDSSSRKLSDSARKLNGKSRRNGKSSRPSMSTGSRERSLRHKHLLSHKPNGYDTRLPTGKSTTTTRTQTIRPGLCHLVPQLVNPPWLGLLLDSKAQTSRRKILLQTFESKKRIIKSSEKNGSSGTNNIPHGIRSRQGPEPRMTRLVRSSSNNSSSNNNSRLSIINS
mmetsp:Transcript_17662/g.38932  ORF Transcript_17662/g.38932 Transcript_17662/m.38932 type:complete len:264 (-) Transcript_17662:373-1164(-)